MTIEINAINENHLEAALALTQRLQWPHRRADWQQALQLGEGLVAEQDGTLLGTILYWRWGHDYASLGLVIVADHAQGKGIGKRLMQTALARLEGHSVRLHATEAGKGLYEKLGFVATGSIEQHQCRSLGKIGPLPPAAGQRLRPARHDDAAVLTALDGQAHGYHRPRLMAVLLEQAERVLVLEEHGAVSGFACLRRFGHGYVVGPIVCGDLPRAQLLVSALLSGLPGQFVRIDTDADSGLGPWLNTLGVPQVDAPTTMIRGRRHHPERILAFGLTTQAMV
ncbi:GNAT family N-acetyltransferase [Serratia sp. AKBS12]|uniref:GNAT family N-acetyltransferase n=1 Tax=Serratia sp. AKBS12 TaxID=2974597 RepID=UPI0021650338|nr:GNAT family N-acetyltransferase [Serratia sp. AKBS12]MCS3408726.1 GNAT family N-acetyltransferase [Serratia sp. AKBS12]